jgi:hypothetical protein
VWPGGAGYRLTCRWPVPAAAAGGLTSPGICGRWLPVRLPAASLATLMVEHTGPVTATRSRVLSPRISRLSGPLRLLARQQADRNLWQQRDGQQAPGCPAQAGGPPSPGERAELVSLRVGQHVPADAAARLAQDRGPGSDERHHGGDRDIQWMRFLVVFGSGTGTKSMVRVGMPGTASTVNQLSFPVTPAP